MFEGAEMKDLHDGDAGDTKEVGGVGGEKTGLNQADDLEDEGGGGTRNADVKAGIEKIIFVFQKAEFELRVAGAIFNLAEATKADAVDGDLQSEKNGQGNEVGGVHSISFEWFIFSGDGGQGETQTIAGQGVGAKPSGFEGSAKEKGEQGGLDEARGQAPGAGVEGRKVGEPAPKAEDNEPGTEQKKKSTDE